MKNDTLVKNTDSKQIIDNINSYDRGRAMINRLFNDRIGLGPVSYTHLTLPTNREV